MAIHTRIHDFSLSALSAAILPGDPGYDEARAGLEPRRRPAPGRRRVPRRRAADVADVVAPRRAAGLRVAVQGAGHNAGPLGDLEDALLLRTSRHGRDVDDRPGRPARPRRRRRALGATSSRPPPPHGLAALHGSSPDVGVVGYSLGGGIGWLARRHGLQTNSDHRGRARDRRRRARPRRRRARARPVLGAARRRRQLRRRHRARVRAAPDHRGLRRA